MAPAAELVSVRSAMSDSGEAATPPAWAFPLSSLPTQPPPSIPSAIAADSCGAIHISRPQAVGPTALATGSTPISVVRPTPPPTLGLQQLSPRSSRGSPVLSPSPSYVPVQTVPAQWAFRSQRSVSPRPASPLAGNQSIPLSGSSLQMASPPRLRPSSSQAPSPLLRARVITRSVSPPPRVLVVPAASSSLRASFGSRSAGGLTPRVCSAMSPRSRPFAVSAGAGSHTSPIDRAISPSVSREAATAPQAVSAVEWRRRVGEPHMELAHRTLANIGAAPVRRAVVLERYAGEAMERGGCATEGVANWMLRPGEVLRKAGDDGKDDMEKVQQALLKAKTSLLKCQKAAADPSSGQGTPSCPATPASLPTILLEAPSGDTGASPFRSLPDSPPPIDASCPNTEAIQPAEADRGGVGAETVPAGSSLTSGTNSESSKKFPKGLLKGSSSAKVSQGVSGTSGASSAVAAARLGRDRDKEAARQRLGSSSGGISGGAPAPKNRAKLGVDRGAKAAVRSEPPPRVNSTSELPPNPPSERVEPILGSGAREQARERLRVSSADLLSSSTEKEPEAPDFEPAPREREPKQEAPAAATAEADEMRQQLLEAVRRSDALQRRNAELERRDIEHERQKADLKKAAETPRPAESDRVAMPGPVSGIGQEKQTASSDMMCNVLHSARGEHELASDSTLTSAMNPPPLEILEGGQASLRESEYDQRLKLLESQQDRDLLRKKLAETQSRARPLETEAEALRKDSSNLKQMLKEAEQEKNFHKQRHLEASQRCAKAEEEVVRLGRVLSSSEQTVHELETERAELAKSREEVRQKLKEATAETELQRLQNKETEELLKVKDEAARARNARQLRSEKAGRQGSTSPRPKSRGKVADRASTLTNASIPMVIPTGTTPRILVTGATGLLGRQVLKALDESWEVRGLGLSRAKAPIIECDLVPSGAAMRQIQTFQPHVVIHLAAERRTEVLLQKKNTEAQLLNVDATGAIATACERNGAWLIYVSTDQVFDGSSPPYSVDAPTNPLNEYGRHKLRGEKLALDASRTACVLRIPQLYGPVEFLQETPVTSLYADLKNGTLQRVDDWQLHYPTWAGDVAQMLRVMIDLHCNGTELRGIYHWHSTEQFTNFEMVRLMAELSGFNVSGIVPMSAPPQTPRRPENAQMDGARLELEMLLPPSEKKCITSFREGLELCLRPFREAEAASAPPLPEAAVANASPVPEAQ